MFALTFLGHQGWLIATESSTILIDPLLTSSFGHGGLLGEVYPPRELELAAFPAIDAVVISHEHDDHFDLPSLACIDRRVPIHLSSRSSIAARELLGRMGFSQIFELRPDSSTEIGDLCVRSFVSDHRDGRQADEWDAFPMLVHDRQGHGSLWTSIDVRPRSEDLRRLGEHAPSPGIWAQANNSSRAGFQDALRSAQTVEGPAHEPDDTALLARVLARRHAALASTWGPPRATLICGAGWSFPGERAWMNHHLFPIDGEQLAGALAGELGPGAGPVRAPLPGQTAIMREGELISLDEGVPFLNTQDRARWPPRDQRGEGPPLRSYAPACGRRRLGADERELLLDELVEFARYLYGTPLFCALHSLPHALPDSREPRLCLSLLDDDAPLVLVHVAQAARFEVVDCGDPIETFVSGLECWASDLLAYLRGELATSALCYAGRLRRWNHAPAQLRASARELWIYGHPLRRPDRAARLYARLLAEIAEPAVKLQLR